MQPGAPERLDLYFTTVMRVLHVEGSFEGFEKWFSSLCSSTVEWTGTGGQKYEYLELAQDGETGSVSDVLSRALAIRYWYDELPRKEKWVRVVNGEKGGLDSKPRPARVLVFHSADLIWLFPHLLIIRGSEEDANEALSRFEDRAQSRMGFERQTFNPYFLFWIWRKWSTNKNVDDTQADVEISKMLKVRKIRDAVALGLPSQTGETVSIDEMETRASLPLLQTLLSGRGFLELRATFEISTGDLLLARVASNGTVRIHVAESIRSSDSLARRFGLSLLFIDELVKAFHDWQKLPNDEREPTEEVYGEIKRTIEDRWAKYIKEDGDIRKALSKREDRRARTRRP